MKQDVIDNIFDDNNEEYLGLVYNEWDHYKTFARKS